MEYEPVSDAFLVEVAVLVLSEYNNNIFFHSSICSVKYTSFKFTPVFDSRNQFPPNSAAPVLSVDARMSICNPVASVSIMYFQFVLEYSAHAIKSSAVIPYCVMSPAMKSENGFHVSSRGSAATTSSIVLFCSDATNR